MPQDVTFKIKQSLEKRMLQLQARLEALASPAALKTQLLNVEAQIVDLKRTLATGNELTPDCKDSLQGRLKNLFTEQQYINSQLELLDDRRCRLRETLDDLQLTYSQYQLNVLPDPRKDWTSNTSQNQHILDEERQKVLDLLKEKQLSVEDADARLMALDEQEQAVQSRRHPRWVQIRVINVDTNQAYVNLTLPIGLVKAGLRAGGTIAGIEGLAASDLEAILDRGEVGQLIYLYNELNNDRLEILVE